MQIKSAPEGRVYGPDRSSGEYPISEDQRTAPPLDEAADRLRRLTELIEDQERRVAYHMAKGDAEGAARAAEMLEIFRQVLLSATHTLTVRRRVGGFGD